MVSESSVTEVVFGEYVITTTVTFSGEVLEGWLRENQELLHGRVVGINAEWRPSENRYENPVAVLQLCVGRRCLIFQLHQAGVAPQSLTLFLANPSFRFVCVGLQEYADRLNRHYSLKVANAIDLRDKAADVLDKPEFRQAELQDLAHTFMGVNLPMSSMVMNSMWHAYRLSDQQIKYACVNAFVCFEVGRKLFTDY